MKQRPSASSPVAATVVAIVLQLSALYTARAANLTNGIYGYWPLNEGAGTSVSDASGNHPPGVIRQNNGSNAPVGLGVNGTVWVTNSPRGTVVGFTGTDTDGYIFLGPDIIPVLGLAADFTWSFWARSDQAANTDTILGNRYRTNPPATDWSPREFIKFTPNSFEWHWNAASEVLDYPNIGVQSNWMHHSVVKQGTNMTYYQNGAQLLKGTISGAQSNPQPLCIGGQGIENWRGYVDEVMVFNRALSVNEVALLYGLTFSGTYGDQLTPAPARAAGQSPPPNATGVAFNTEINVTIVEGTTKLNDSSVEFKVNGQIVARTISARTDLAPGVTAVLLKVPGPVSSFYPPLSTVSVECKFADNAGTQAQLSWSFVVQDYVNIPPSWSVSDVDTNKPGFRVRAYQLDDRAIIFSDRGGRIPSMEKQLAGRIGPNLADMTSFTDNKDFVETGYINYHELATSRNDPVSSIGNFGALTIPAKLENPVPGFPGSGPAPGDFAAFEILAYLDLPAGPITMGVNSDDGFRLTMSPIGALRDKMGREIALFDNGRTVANTEGQFVIQQAGRYAMRLMWFEILNDSSVEWYTVKDGVRHLVNDAADPASFKAYFGRIGPEPAYISVIDPFPFPLGSVARGFPDDPIHIEITDGGTAVQTNSIVLRVFGQAVTPTLLTKNGAKTTVEYLLPGGLWPPWPLGTNVTVDLIYTHSSTVTNSWTNQFVNYVALQNTLRTAVGTGRTNGLSWRTHQWERTTTRANTVAAAEDQLANQTNSANLSSAINGYFQVDYVNFDRDGIARGYFSELQPSPRSAIELPIPGAPGPGPYGTNNIVGEATTFLEFTNAGMYYMAVNHKDSFQLTVATTEGFRSLTTGPDLQLIGSFVATAAINANNVQNDNLLAVYVPQPGVWPFRLLYFVGTGLASVEWYQTDKRTGIGLINDPSQPTIRAYRSRSVAPPPAAPKISIARTQTGISVTFEGTLYQADQAAGPFTQQVPNATSPWPLTPSAVQKFYRSAR